MKQAKQTAIFRSKYSSSQTVETPYFALGFQRSLNSAFLANVSFTRPFGKFSFERKKVDAQSLPFTVTLYRMQWKEYRTKICSKLVIYCCGILLGYRIPLMSVVKWHRTCWIHIPYPVKGTVSEGILDVCLSWIEQLNWFFLGQHLGFSQGLEKFFAYRLMYPNFARAGA